MKAAQAFPPPGDIVIFQPEFVEFGGEERVILSLSEGLHAQGKAHSVLCYRDHIGLARHARLALPVFELQPAAGGWLRFGCCARTGLPHSVAPVAKAARASRRDSVHERGKRGIESSGETERAKRCSMWRTGSVGTR